MAVFTKTFDEPDEQRTPDKTKVDVVKLPGASVARITFQPGWRWSECIRPVVGGESCQVRHVGTLLSGEMQVVHDDGGKANLTPGIAYIIEPGHDAWVVGDEPAVGLEFESHSAEIYAKS
ncbi:MULTISPECIES: cupin domain-containing protein [unclassified Kribbella]|uniref:cupin domain-containing protein n=1 Tax=unclassified Kribbella TaxID=2644121 RepID=UPI00301B07AB